MESFTNAEDLNRRTIETKEKIIAGGKGALNAHFELNKLAEEAENVREEALKANAEFDENNKVKIEETVVSTESKENQFENKTRGPIFMVFRENNNWDKYAQKIIDHIKLLGGEIEMKSFPRGTDNEIIKEWYQQNKNNFEGKFLLTDKTCEPERGSVDSKEKYNLDQFLENSNKKIINNVLKEAFGENGGNNVIGKERYTKIFKLALEKYTPEKITLVKRCFGDHVYFVSGNRNIENDKDNLEFVKQCLIDAGYPESSISTVIDIEDTPNPEEIKSMEKEWFFIDSHNSIGRVYNSKGLNVFGPDEIIKTVGINNDSDMYSNLINEIDDNFKKIDSVESFILKYTSNPEFNDGEYSINEMIKCIGNGDKIIEIVSYLIDLHKDNDKWKVGMINKFNRMKSILKFAEKYHGLVLNQEKKEELLEKIDKIMTSYKNNK